ncbi:hypothetical protein CAK77_12710 [Mycobacteroides abscessus subsp. massiliense]|nr:hypothetical protein CAK77_12710 [Mycobacteroides abscessus subsp. massiliense]OTR10195.1 hypothetical protein B9M82_14000 [Mycobacteroides abscessus]
MIAAADSWARLRPWANQYVHGLENLPADGRFLAYRNHTAGAFKEVHTLADKQFGNLQLTCRSCA